MDKDLVIAPEALTTANAYINNEMSLELTAQALEIPVHIVQQQLGKKEVKSYVQSVLMDMGYNNNYKLHSAMDSIIDKKLLEMEDLDMGSTKDIIEIIALKHKMAMDERKLEIELEKTKAGATNIQVNNNYNNLLEKIIKADV